MKAYPEYMASGIDWLGNIPSHWGIVRTQYLFDIYSGSTPNSNEQIFWDGEIKWITPADFNTTDKYVSQGKRNLSQKGYNSCSTTLVPVGSIVFSKLAPIGKVCLTKTSLCTNQGCFTCVPKNVCVDYYYYLMSILEKIYNLYGSGSTFTEISAKDFSLFKLIVPSLAEQEAIAAYLDDVTGKIDALISEKRKQVEDIRAYRTSLITEIVTRGLNPDAPLRPSGIDWFGDIPEHWEILKGAWCCTFQYGFPADSRFFSNERKGIPLIRIRDIFSHDTEVYYNNSDFTTEYIVNNGDILIGMDGDFNVSCWKGGISLLNQRVCKFEKSDSLIKGFLFYVLPIILKEINNIKYSTTVKHLSAQDLLEMRLPVPPLAEQQAIADFLDAKTAKIDELIGELTKQIDELTEYKQAVITEAVTGKVDVRDYKPST